MRNRILRKTCFALIAVGALATAMATALATAHAETLALIGATVIDGTGHAPREDATVLVRDGKITFVSDGRVAFKLPADTRVLHLEGKTLLPGLINTHVHLSMVGHNDYARWDREFPQARLKSEIFPATARALLASGVTTARDLGGDLDDLLWMRAQLEQRALPGPRLLIAGPFLCTPTRQFSASVEAGNRYWIIRDAADARAKVRELAKHRVDVIKLWDDAFTVDVLTALISEAHAHNLRVAAHLLTLAGVQNVLAAGLGQADSRGHNNGDSIEHLGAGEGDRYPDDVVQTIVSRGIYVSPTLIAFDGLRQIVADPQVMDDAQGRSMIPAPVYADVLASFKGADPKRNPIYHYVFDLADARKSKVQQLRAAGARFSLGSDSGSRANPHHLSEWREMVLLQEQAGLAPMQVIESATRIPAQQLGLADHIGTIEVGKVADLVVIDGDPLVHMADMQKGRAGDSGGASSESRRLAAGRHNATAGEIVEAKRSPGSREPPMSDVVIKMPAPAAAHMHP